MPTTVAVSYTSVEVKLPWNGDFSITPQGDLELVQGVPAVQQRMVQGIETNPRETVYARTGVAVVLRADDLFHVTYGGGVRRLIGRPPGVALISEIKSRITKVAVSDPSVARTPPPVISITSAGGGLFIDEVSVNSVTGQYVPVPTDALQIF